MRLHLALLLLPLTSALLIAQTCQPKIITFTGAPALSQAEQLAASGLTPGKQVSVGDIQAATQRLADTGAFAEVSFAYDAQSTTFTVKPAESMRPAHYINFPWWADAELTSDIAARVPLFHGTVPFSGAMEFRMTEPQVVIGALSYPGDTSGWAPALAEVSKAETGKEYTETKSASMLQDAVLHVYRGKGFAQAAVTTTQAGRHSKKARRSPFPSPSRSPLGRSTDLAASHRLARY